MNQFIKKISKYYVWIILLMVFIAVVVVDVIIIGYNADKANKEYLKDYQEKTDNVVSISDILTEEPSNTATDLGNTTTEQEVSIEVNDYIFVGDSRYVGMKAFEEEEDLFICEKGANYMFLTDNWNQVISNAGEGDVIVVGLGINDVNSNSASQYIDLLTRLREETSAMICFTTANPVDEELEALNGYTIQNSTINSFNSQIIQGVKDLDIVIIDTNSYLQRVGFYAGDGLHYDHDTYGIIYDYIKEYIENGEY